MLARVGAKGGHREGLPWYPPEHFQAEASERAVGEEQFITQRGQSSSLQLPRCSSSCRAQEAIEALGSLSIAWRNRCRWQ